MTNDGIFRSARPFAVSDFGGRTEAALRGMDALRRALEMKLAMLEAMSLEDLKLNGYETLLRDLGKSVSTAVNEQGKIADVLRIERGGDGIDLDAARASIGSRLDRIRASLGAERLFERPDGG